MTNKKLGLLLAPLLPITAIGIVEVAGALASMNEPAKVAIVEVQPSTVAPAPIVEPAPEPIIAPTYSAPDVPPAPMAAG